MRDLYVVALVLLAGLAGTVMQSPQSSRETGAQIGSVQTGVKADEVPKGPLTIVCGASAACDKNHIRPELIPENHPAGPVDLKVLIAFVPDPDRTNLRLYFDRAVESLENAAQDEGYRFLDYWLPWPSSPLPNYELRKDREDEKTARRAGEDYPGVLVFQGGGGKPGLLVFLVGDRPSAGYSKPEFDNALVYEGLLHPEAEPLHIVGPDFSGSLSLLRLALRNVHGRDIVVHSGSATNPFLLNLLKDELKARGEGSGAYTYLACDDEVQNRLIDFLKNHMGAKPPFSMLHESRTAFGTGFGSSKAFCVAPSSDPQAFVSYSFPPGLSYVRKAYGQTRTSTSTDGAPETISNRPSLQLDLSTTEQGQDQQPELSSTTPVSHDAELAAASEALQHDRIHYAGVVATDPLDTLFVASYLRSAVPDTRLVLMDADVLDALPGNDISLQGSLLVSSYPVFFEPQGWYKNALDRPVFSSQFEEGVYNAARSFLHPEDGTKPLEPTRIWISVIGRDGLWPVSVQKEDITDPRPLGWSWPPRVWVALACVLAFVLLTFFTGFILAQKEQPDRWCADLSLFPTRGNLAARGSYITGIAISLLGCWLAGTAGQIGLFWEQPNFYWFGGRTVAAIATLFLVFSVWISIWTIREFFPGPGPRLAAAQSGSGYLGYLSFPWIVFGSYAVALLLTMSPGDNKEGYFFSLRSIELGSGVSPALPFLFICISFVLFCVTQLKRVVFADERFQRVPTIESDGLQGVLGPRLEELDALLSAPLLRQPWNVVLACLVFPLAAFLFARYSLESLEGRWFDWAYAISVAAVCLAMVLTTSRFWFCWRLLQRVLEALDMHPIREAFNSVPKDSSWSSVWKQSSGKRSYRLYSITLECLRKLKGKPGFETLDFDRIERLSNELTQSVSSGVRERMQVYWNLQREMYVAGCLASEALQGPTRSKDDIKKFIALRYASLFRYVMAHLRNLATFLTFGYVLLALSLGSYPFLAPRGIAWFLSIMLIGLSVPVVSVFHEMSVDPILTRMTQAAEGKTDWGFITRTASFTALPILSMMASHFPVVGKYVLSWVQPALKSIH
jgi:hypothetical protein